MSDRVIEPSEIITGREEDRKAPPSHVNPLLRLAARAFDYSVFFGLLYFFFPPLLYQEIFNFIPVVFFAWIPVEALLLFTLGTTPGKWLLHTQLFRHHRRRLPLDVALRRSFAVWLRGLGLGIPIVNVFCIMGAYQRLKLLGATSWDREEGIVITHLPLPRWRFHLIAGFAMVGFGLYAFNLLK